MSLPTSSSLQNPKMAKVEVRRFPEKVILNRDWFPPLKNGGWGEF